ncbi:dihydrodipicolinate synthase family protein [Stackebrandtia soli]|uniref:dihydrodipicolinate synthase family protein n=1 Tax=Stackebrandtia soli TaxID=1892856 RepID=UPI0039E82387
MVATALPFTADGGVDFDAYAEHVAWLVESGCDGVVPNGSLGEYQTLTEAERDRVLAVAVEAVGADRVMPGVAAYGAEEARRLTDRAAAHGCGAVMLLPPNAYRADVESVVDHYRRVSASGVPIVAYNNPIDTKVDLTPELLGRLHGDGLIVAVKEFSGDVRRAWQIAEAAPGLDLLVGSDDVLVEMLLAGAVGWVAGYPNALPDACVTLYRAALDGDLDRALPLYRTLHPLLRWDSRVQFVQAIKLSMDLAGRTGGACRPPRLPLDVAADADVRRHTERALSAGLR